MTIATPPKPPPDRPDLEALIEEARRRTRRRRLKYAVAAVLAFAVAGGSYGGFALSRDGTSTQPVPPGFHLVQARGPVSRAVIEIRDPRPLKSLDLASGSERPAKVTWEAWFDGGSGLDRVIQRVDGKEQFDLVGQAMCVKPRGGNPRFCIPPGPPFNLKVRGFRWPLNPRNVRQVGTGTFRGHDVIWVAGLTNGRLESHADRVALDRATHELLVYQIQLGPHVYQQIYSSLEDLAGRDVSFVVPNGGPPTHSFPPAPSLTTEKHASRLAAARDLFGSTPFWLGPSFGGQSLDSVEVGTERAHASSGSAFDSARFLQLRYGPFTIREFGADRPVWQTSGPAPGQALLGGYRASLTRAGFLILITRRFRPANRDEVLAIAQALRPIPAE